MPRVRLVLLLIIHCSGYWNFSQMLMNASAFYRVAWILRELSWTLQDRVPFPLDAVQLMESFAYEDVILWSLMFRICPSGTGGQRIAVSYLPIPAASIGCFYECLLLCCEVMFLHSGITQHGAALHCPALHFLPTFYNNCEDHLHLSLSNCTVFFKCLLNSSCKIAAPWRVRTETSFHVHCL